MASKSRVRSDKPKALKKKGLRLRRKKKKPEIVIDREEGLVFATEKALFEHFNPQIEALEKEYRSHVQAGDIAENEVSDLEKELDKTLEEPAEIWHDANTFTAFPIFHFIRPMEDMDAFHVAVAYVNSEDEATFVFLHFATRFLDTVEPYRRGDLIYDRAYEEVGFGMIEGDALSDGDPLSMGLFIAMLKLRGEKDVPYERFQELGQELREDTIENADEIWRTTDLHGNSIVTFIKEFPDHEIRDLYYVAITQEDTSSNVHSLLFSFPTTDENLIDRYRHGDNLQADEVSQESSH